MKPNSIKTISKTINLLDNKIKELLQQTDIDENKLDILSNIRLQFKNELDSLLRIKNTRDMFNKK